MKRMAIIAASIAASSCAHVDPQLRADAGKTFGRIEAPSPAAISRPEATLGRALFWDTRLSIDGKTACASCHLDHGADRRVASIDANALPTSRHSPTVFNSMGQPSLRWLGDRKTGAEQAEGSMTGSMGFATKQAAVQKLVDLGYAAAFANAYPAEKEPLNSKNYGLALQAYQATLATPAPFDRYLAGDESALNSKQKEGLRTFVATGCSGCHNRPLLGGRMFMKFGLVRDYWLETGSAKPDVGRFSMTKNEADRYVFRVAMLRNVARTAPYFHDGSVATLPQAVKVMGATQLGRKLDDETVGSIVAFLESLTGEAPAHYSAPK